MIEEEPDGDAGDHARRNEQEFELSEEQTSMYRTKFYTAQQELQRDPRTPDVSTSSASSQVPVASSSAAACACSPP
jgi:hypothetical protein